MVVYIDSENVESLENLSPVVVGALNTASMGRTIPKAVVTSPDQNSFYASITYKQMKEPKNFRKANKQIKAALGGEQVEIPKDLVHNWVQSGSRTRYLGSFVEMKDDKNLVLKLTNGKNYSIPLAKLSAGSKAYARMLAGGGAGEGASKEEKTQTEPWTNTKGKVIQARFISLKDGKITLAMKNGKSVTFDLALLSEESQKRAKELAKE